MYKQTYRYKRVLVLCIFNEDYGSEEEEKKTEYVWIHSYGSR